jgi:putative ABC transport system substrate-binding protein
MLLTELSVKELEILREILPEAESFGVLWNPSTPSHPTALKEIEGAGTSLSSILF